MKKPFVLTVYSNSERYERILKEMNVPSYLKTDVHSNGFYGVRFEIQPFSGRGSTAKNKQLMKLCYP